MLLTLQARHPETHDVETFLFQPDQPLSYKPGQYLRWILPHEPADDRGTSRFFSMASAPSEPHIQLSTKFAVEKGSSFKSHLKQLQPGGTIQVAGPMGSFVLPEDVETPVVLVAGGIGITPFRSMLVEEAAQKRSRPIHLVYGARSDADFAFRDLFDKLQVELPSLQISYFTELLSAEVIDKTVAQATQHAVYLSGPEPMIKALKDDLMVHGHAEENVKTDYFPGYLVI